MIDEFQPESEYPFFQVSAHDRNSRAVIEIGFGENRQIEKVSLAKASELKRLPTVLKKCVRAHLDLVGDIVLNAEREDEDSDDMALRQKKEDDFKEAEAEETKDAITGDLFEETFEDDIFDSLPALDDLNSLDASGLEGE